MNRPVVEPMVRCIGFGEREGRCENEAGTPWTKLWCPECDKERRSSITASFDQINDSFAKSAPGGEQR